MSFDIHITFLLLFLTSSTFSSSLDTLSLKSANETIQDYEQFASLEDVQDESAQYIPFKYELIPVTPELYGPLGVVPLVNFLNTQFHDEAQLETLSQKLEIMLESNSSSMFTLALNCTGLACWGRTYSNYMDSMSFFLNRSLIRLDFGSGHLTGFVGVDVASAGDLAVKNFSFVVIDSPDGIIWLAFDNLAVNNIPTFFHALLQQEVIREPSYSFYLTKDLNANGSVLILGGIDKKYAKSEFHEINVTLTPKSYLMTSLDDFQVENMSVVLENATSINPDLHFLTYGKDDVIPHGFDIIQNFIIVAIIMIMTEDHFHRKALRRLRRAFRRLRKAFRRIRRALRRRRRAPHHLRIAFGHMRRALRHFRRALRRATQILHHLRGVLQFRILDIVPWILLMLFFLQN